MLIQVKAVLSCSVTSFPLRYGNLISHCIQISCHLCVAPLLSLIITFSSVRGVPTETVLKILHVYLECILTTFVQL